jgi:hypothetical protein
MGRPKGSKNSRSIDLEERQSERETRAVIDEQAIASAGASQKDQPFAENPEAEKKNKKDRISIQLTEDGLLDTDSMRAGTLAKVREFFQDPENQKLLGATSTVKVDDVISEKDVDMLFDLVGTIEGWGFSIIGKIDGDIAAAHAAWTPDQKKMVVPPAQRVIAKNAAAFAPMLRWKDEIVLGVIFLAISRAKFESARNDQKKRNEYHRANGGAVDVNPADFRSVTEQKQ